MAALYSKELPMKRVLIFALTSLTLTVAASALADDACLPTLSGVYKFQNGCTIGGHDFGSSDAIILKQNACTDMVATGDYQVDVQKYPEAPGAGPYDMCSLAQNDCALYGDNCAKAATKECQDWFKQLKNWPKPIWQKRTASESVSFSEISFARTKQIDKFGDCKVYTRLR
jgi:hypothetical protein